MEGIPGAGRGRSRPDGNLVSRFRSFIRARPLLRAFLITLIVFFFLLLPAWWVAGVWYEDHLVTETRAEVISEVSISANRLSQALNQRIALLEGLSAFVTSDPSTEHLSRNFDPFAAGLYSGAPGIRNFAVAPGGIQTYVYPLKGNENVPGHNLLTDERPDVRSSVNQTITTWATVLQGPYELRQGGLGLVIRKAVYVNGGFWGLSTMVIDMPPVLDQAGFTDNTSSLALAAKNDDGMVFTGDPGLFTRDSIIQPIPVGSGTWEVAGMPGVGWAGAVADRMALFRAAGLVIVVLLGLLVFVSALQEGDTRRGPGRSVFELSPFWICCIYLAFGVVWILASDLIVGVLLPDAGASALAQSIKGLFFIVVTALVLYALISYLAREIRWREQDLARVVEAGNVGLWDWDLQTNKVFFSKEWKRQIGYDEGEIPGDFSEWESRVHPDDIGGALRLARAFIEGSIPEYHIEFRLRHKDGSYRWILAQASLLRDADGKPVRMLGSHIDITRQKEAERAWRESEEKLHLFIQYAPTALAMFDRDMHYIAASERWITDYHLEGIETIGRSHYDVFPEIPGAWKDVHNRGLAGEVVRADEDRFVRAEGSVQWIRWEVRPWYTAETTVGGIIIFSEDITGRKQAEEALRHAHERLRFYIDANIVGVLLAGPDGNIVEANDYFLRLIGYTREEFGAGLVNWRALTPPEWLPSDERAIAELRERGVCTPYEKEYARRDGTRVSVLLIDAMLSGPEEQIAAFVLDITDRKRAEAALMEAHRDLERKVIERTRELSEANVRLQELDRLKSMFIASMSHELRTPLNSIIGFTGIIVRGLAGEVNHEQQKQLIMVQESARHLLGLINEIIDISKIEADKIEPVISTFDLATLIAGVRDTFASAAGEKGIVLNTVMPETSLQVTTDERRVRQVVTNLVSNAVKFTDRGGIEVVTFWEGENVEVTVRDTGIGIRKEDLGRLFQPFSRITDPARPTEGSGLGLYLSQKLARFLGGEITAASEPGWGSTFSFRFPREFTGKTGEAAA